MRAIAALIVCLFFALTPNSAALASVTIDINLSTQTMQVRSPTGETYSWPISTARSGYVTPRGYYRPQRLEAMHYSAKYHMSPMPHSIFFRGGYAIHGTASVRDLGRPASHGCVRLAPTQAAKLFAMVKREGARIQISGTPPPSKPFAQTRAHQRHNLRQAQPRKIHVGLRRARTTAAAIHYRRVIPDTDAPMRGWRPLY